MGETVQKNFRLSSRSIKLLDAIVKSTKLTATSVVEMCIAKFALETGVQVENAQRPLFKRLVGDFLPTEIELSESHQRDEIKIKQMQLEAANSTAPVFPSDAPANAALKAVLPSKPWRKSAAHGARYQG